MRIVADENIPVLLPFFDMLGEVTALPGREISREHLLNADLLLVRSITPVGADLLDGTSVRFVATATIGSDHVDRGYLQARQIGFANAPGCNAQSVVEYVLSALSILTEIKGFRLDEISVGIVGRGEIGGRLEKTLRAMGVVVKATDPPREAAGEGDLDSLEQVLECDVVTVHVPYVAEGAFPTHQLVNRAFLDKMEGHQILINTSRGRVVDEEALKARLKRGDGFSAILDVWRNEPAIDAELASLCTFATPHIAGYSLDGRAAATEIVYQKVCQHFGLPVRVKAGQYLPEPPLKKLSFSPSADTEWAFHTAIRACYDLRHDHANLMRVLKGAAPAVGFDLLRKQYRQRRGFAQVKIKLKGPKAELASRLAAAGYSFCDK
ncbi:MAG: 4-phosphoerythronate dehydrogenase [Hahellaceae bacterium]|nr:4-phosphoerythronate dehydrogenase [Hahellaceae bacterium]